MITIQKQNVANWLMAEYLATSHAINEKLRLFEQKYAQTWDEFSTEVKTASNEDFNQWDDYIEWKAYLKMAKDLAFKIDKVKHGNFEIARPQR
ncbi:MAG: hypothetical protein GY805_05720 [Chloroflexi bacterium]|nr:hypothetical protein [Chloroflexota bacterium]